MNDDLGRMEQDIREGIAALNPLLHGAGTKLDEFGKAVKKNTKKGTTRKVTDALVETAEAFKTLGDSTSSIETLKPILGKAADMVGSAAGKTPYLGEALQNLSRIAAQTGDAVIDELSMQAKAFHSLSVVGATAADGISDLQRQWFQSGMKLESYTKAITSSATTLARFGTTVSGGAESYSKIIGELAQGDDDRLRMLGFSAEDMASSTEAYLDIQTKLGRSQTMTARDLTEGAKQYSFELDILARATGASREEIEKQQKELMNEDKFAATMFLMEQEGKEKQIEEIKNIQSLLMKNAGPNIAKGFRDTLSEGGLAYSETAKSLSVQTGGASVEIAKKLKEGSIGAEEAERLLRDALRKNSDFVARNASIMGESVGVYGKNFHEVRDFVNGGEDALTASRKQQEEQIKREDAFTKNVIKTQKAMEKSYIDYHKLISKTLPVFESGLVMATNALVAFADGMDKFSGGETLKTGSGPSGGAGIGESSGNAVVDQARKMLGKNENIDEKELTDYLNAYSGSYLSTVKGAANAWCARFVNATLEASGVKGNKSMSAASFKTFGQEVYNPASGNEGLTNARPGDIVVIGRQGGSGSHVAIFEGYDPLTGKVKVIGGNQSDSVSETTYHQRQIQAIRRATGSDKATTSAQPAQPPATTSPAAPEAQAPTTTTTTPVAKKPARISKPVVIDNSRARSTAAGQQLNGVNLPQTGSVPTLDQSVASVGAAQRDQQRVAGHPTMNAQGREFENASSSFVGPMPNETRTSADFPAASPKPPAPNYARPPLPATGIVTPDTPLSGPTNEYSSQVESPAPAVDTPDTSMIAEANQDDIFLDNMIANVAKRSAKMDELIALMRKQNGTTDKMLKVKS
jgi:uncharacterized protein (TIGR02594 family)